MKAELYIKDENILGEGPVWDAPRNELLWVDIEGSRLCFFNIETGDISRIELDSRIGAAVPIEGEGTYMVALQSGLKIFNRKTGVGQLISNPEDHILQNRFNDGKCDPAGRFWIGSMDLEAKESRGNLYCIDNNLEGVKKIGNVTVSNGLAWSPDYKKFYFIDSPTFQVVQYEYELKSGLISNPEVAIRVPDSHGSPDGMCIDSEGMLWIAHWGGSNISRWNPQNGKLLQKIDVPAVLVTSCCFGGENLDTLYITSARIGLSKQQLERYPLSGSIFCTNPGVSGWQPLFFKPVQ